ncbi:MAG: hypothetical protein HYU66_14285 [Armatimonadetes bacterium]|nr:hypothetical protein [Armatimonadota bacterium]
MRRLPGWARAELRADPACAGLTTGEARWYAERALDEGRRQAEPYRGRNPLELAAELGVSVSVTDRDPVVAGRHVLAEYDAATRGIAVCRASLEERADEVGERRAMAEHVAHELYHHLEATCLGRLEERLPPVVVRQVLGLWPVRRRVRACSEIAARAFAETLAGAALEGEEEATG